MAVHGKERVASAVPKLQEARFRKEAGLLIRIRLHRDLIRQPQEFGCRGGVFNDLVGVGTHSDIAQIRQN